MAHPELTLDFYSNAHLACDMQTQTSPANVNRNIRLFRADDLSVMADWWGYHRKDDFHAGPLSTLGVVVEGEEQEAVGFLYKTNSPRCFADYIVVNPALNRKGRDDAISALMDSLIGIAAEAGFKIIEGLIKGKKLIKRCEERGFVTLWGDNNMQYMGRRL